MIQKVTMIDHAGALDAIRELGLRDAATAERLQRELTQKPERALEIRGEARYLARLIGTGVTRAGVKQFDPISTFKPRLLAMTPKKEEERVVDFLEVQKGLARVGIGNV